MIELTEENLISRAIGNARDVRARAPEKQFRWVAVGLLFRLNGSDARELCKTYGYDPDEKVAKDAR